MTKEEYEKRVKEYLYKACGNHEVDIDAEIEKEKEWFFSYYDEAKKTGDFDHAVSLACTNFAMWV